MELKISSSTDFSSISTVKDLIEYLTSYNRIDTGKSIYHYTHLDSILNIIKTGYWVIKSPKGMNDSLEYQSWEEEHWNNVFFASLMLEQKESIGMWSMYAQPWDKGVKVAIDGVAFKKWIRGIKEIYLADPDTYEIFPNPIPLSPTTTVEHAAVAYLDFDNESQAEILRYSNKINRNITDVYSQSQLCGYIKNDAWRYEREIRLRAVVDKTISARAVAIKLTDDLIKAITIVKGPRFKGDLIAIIQKELEKEKSSKINIDSSLFFGKLNTVACDYCKRSSVLNEFETPRLTIKTKIKIENKRPMLSRTANNQEIDIINLTENKFDESGFLCYSRDSGELVCHVGLSDHMDKMEISYGTENAFQGKGYMNEALPVIIGWLFTYTTINQIYARTSDNPISEHILIKNHFKRVDEEYHKVGKLYKLIKEIKQ